MLETAELPGAFWGGWVLVLTVGSLAGLAWLVFSVYFGRGADEEEASPVWDGNLQKGAHPAPLWWFWLLFGSLVISVVYLMLYPGLGVLGGALEWSQGGELRERQERFATRFGPTRQLVAQAELETLQANPALMASAQRVYDRNCATCHGYDARGQANLFPDLRDAAWQWGGDPAQIDHSIRHGRQAVMVGWLPVVGDETVDALTDYVLALGDGAPADHPGAQPYTLYCGACHGPDGAGNPLLGASNLLDDISLYGNSEEAIRHSIAVGREGEMPAFADRLDDTQIRLLVAWLTPPTP